MHWLGRHKERAIAGQCQLFSSVYLQMPQEGCTNQAEKAFPEEKKDSTETETQEKGQEEKSREEGQKTIAG
jgi:hypothetical protein